MKKLNIAKTVKASDFDPIVEMAKLIGKGGKYANKDIEKVMKEEYGDYLFVEVPVDVKSILSALEADNYHNEYAILQALKDNDKDAVKPLIFIYGESVKAGGIDYGLQQLRDYFNNRDWYLGLLQEQKNTIKKTPVVSKALKLMSKKDVERLTPFLS